MQESVFRNAFVHKLKIVQKENVHPPISGLSESLHGSDVRIEDETNKECYKVQRPDPEDSAGIEFSYTQCRSPRHLLIHEPCDQESTKCKKETHTGLSTCTIKGECDLYPLTDLSLGPLKPIDYVPADYSKGRQETKRIQVGKICFNCGQGWILIQLLVTNESKGFLRTGGTDYCKI